MLTRYNLYAKHVNEKNKKSKIWRYLKEEIDFLLASSTYQFNSVDFDKLYVSVPEAEEYLSSALNNSLTNRVLYFTGLVGSGKSMIIRKVFNIHGMVAEIDGNNLIIPFSFDNLVMEKNISSNNIEKIEECIDQLFINMLASTCEKMEKEFSDLVSVKDNIDRYYEYIEDLRGDLMQFGRTIKQQSRFERVNNLFNRSPIVYYTSVLKYYMSQDSCSVNNLVFVVDDVEGVGENCESYPIKVAYRILTCFENQRECKNWSVQLIVGCRNYVYRLLQTVPCIEKQQIETYMDSDMFHIDESVTLNEIILKRYNAIIDNMDSEKWRTALGVVQILLNDVNRNIGQFIINLNIGNLRKSLTTLKHLVFNKQWVERDYQEVIPGAFTIKSIDEYDLNPTTLIRAIALRESIIYCSEDSLMPNILYNKNNRDLYVLLIIKYCIMQYGERYSNWNHTIILSDFYQKIESIFRSKIEINNFTTMTHYLLVNRLLLKSLDQFQFDTIPVNESNCVSINCVYLSHLAIDLWKLLGENSVLLEMAMDDIWVNNSQRDLYKRVFRGLDLDNFNVALEYMNVLIEKETQLRDTAYNLGTLDDYYSVFGEDSITLHLLNGLSNSLKVFYKEEASSLKEYTKIQELNEIINKQILNK